jgi:hypothetical protein
MGDILSKVGLVSMEILAPGHQSCGNVTRE